MSFFGSSSRTPPKLGNSPMFPKREEIIAAYEKFAGRTPTEDEIRSHLGNPGGIAAVEAMLAKETGSDILPEPYVPDVPISPPVSGGNEGTPGVPGLIAENCNPVGMSYWRCINNHAGSSNLRVVLTINNRIHIFTIRKSDLTIAKDIDLGINDTGEQVYFSASAPMWLYIREEKRLYMYNIETGETKTVMEPPAGMNLWQCHSSWDDQVHSASLQDNNYQVKAWGVKTQFELKTYDIQGEPDECQIDKTGLFLVAKETRNGSEDNRIIRISNNQEYWITDREGAIGHSDTGPGFVVGEDNYIGGCVMWRLGNASEQKRVIYGPNVWNMGYVSVSKNLRSCLITLPDKLVMIKLDGSKDETYVCPALTQSQEYEHRAKANLCPLGQFAVWSAFVGNQLNAYIVRIPNSIS